MKQLEIIIKPQKFTGRKSWESKWNGVILVEKEEDIEPLYKLLVDQDEYWKNYKHLIKVAPKEIESIVDISIMCEYVGKTDIYEPEKIQQKIPFIMYQYMDSENDW